MCWYKTPAEKAANKKRCMEVYSQEDGATFGWAQAITPPTFPDYEQNGRYCKSGLAYGDGDKATCVSTYGISFDGELTSAEEHWPCTPGDPLKKCNILFEKTDGSEGSFDVDCKCSLSSQLKEYDELKLKDMSEKELEEEKNKSHLGYCSSVIGTEFYRKAVRAKKLVYERSGCHTLDRENFRAQKDDCGIGMKTEQWRYAVDQHFNATHWPYIQDHDNYHCVNKFFSDSFINLSLDAGIIGYSSMATVFVALIADSLF